MLLLISLFACDDTAFDSRNWQETVDEPYEKMRIHADSGTVALRGTDDAETHIAGDVTFELGETAPATDAEIVDGELRLGAPCDCTWSWDVYVPRDVALDIVIEGDGSVDLEDLSGDVSVEIDGEGALYAEVMAGAAFVGRVFDGPIHATFLDTATDIDVETGRDGIISVFVAPGAWALDTSESVRLDEVTDDPAATRTLRAVSENVVDIKGRAYQDL